MAMTGKWLAMKVADKVIAEWVPKVLEWQAMAEGAYSPNTFRAQKAGDTIFQNYCEDRGVAFLPADPMTIREFIEVRLIG